MRTGFSLSGIAKLDRGRRSGAFTLVEMLVAMGVLTLLILMIAQLTNGAVSTTSASHKRMDEEGQARLVLDRLALDFSKMLKRDDVDLGFAKASGNDALSFYSETAGYQSTGAVSLAAPRKLAVIGYRVNTTGPASESNMLARGARAIDWGEMVFSAQGSGTQTQSLEPPNSLPAVDAASTASMYQVLGDQVFRFEFCYLTKGDPSTGTQPALTAKTPGKLADIGAIIVGIAVLDERSRTIVSPGRFNQLVSALPDASDGQDVASLWAPIVSQSANLASLTQIPLSAASSVRIYQRYYYLRSGL